MARCSPGGWWHCRCGKECRGCATHYDGRGLTGVAQGVGYAQAGQPAPQPENHDYLHYGVGSGTAPTASLDICSGQLRALSNAHAAYAAATAGVSSALQTTEHQPLRSAEGTGMKNLNRFAVLAIIFGV
jgi:hypothetical protein